MKTTKKLLTMLAIAIALSIASPSVFSTHGIQAKAAARISESQLTLIKGQKSTLKVKGAKGKVKWMSGKKSVATVSQKGEVTAKKKGTATISCKVGNKRYACIVTVQTPRLSKTKLTLKEDNSYTLKMSGTDQKVKWESSDSSIAAVNNEGRITAKNEGTAKITATVLKKKYVCTVDVEKHEKEVTEEFDADEAKKNIAIELNDTGKGIIAILKNNNKYIISAEVKIVYYKDGKMLDAKTDNNYIFENGSECVLHFPAPVGADYNYVAYDDYQVLVSVGEVHNVISDVNSIGIQSNIGSDNVIAEVTNNSKNHLGYIRLYIVYYDENGDAIDYDYSYAECGEPGTSDYVTFDLPYDSNYDYIIPADYKIYVNYAYSYVW